MIQNAGLSSATPAYPSGIVFPTISAVLIASEIPKIYFPDGRGIAADFAANFNCFGLLRR